MKFRDKGILPAKDMRGMTGREYLDWLHEFLLYEDDNQPKIPRGKDAAFYDEMGAELARRDPVGKRVI